MRFLISLLATALTITIAPAHANPPLSPDIAAWEKQTQQAVRDLSYTESVLVRPAKTTTVGDVRLNVLTPWEPFDRSRSSRQGKYALLAPAVQVLEEYRQTPNDLDDSGRSHAVVEAAVTIATIGGHRAVRAALPALLRIMAQKSYERRSPMGTQLLNCLVTLCGADNVAREIAAQTMSPDANVRISAVTVWGRRESLLGNFPADISTNGAKRPSFARQHLRETFLAHLPTVARVAARDISNAVRLAGTNALRESVGGARNAPQWKDALPVLAGALNRSDTPVTLRREIAALLAGVVGGKTYALPTVRRLLADPDAETARTARTALAVLVRGAEKEEITRLYVRELRSKNQRTRKNALAELNRVVLLLWSNDSPKDNAATIERHKRLLSALTDVARHDPDTGVKLSAARCVEQIGNGFHQRLRRASTADKMGEEEAILRSALVKMSEAVTPINPAFGFRLTQALSQIKTPYHE